MAKKTKDSSSSTSNGSNGNSALSKLKSVYEFMTQHNLDTIELDEQGTHLKLVRRKALPPMPVPVPVAAYGAASAPTAPAAGAAPAPAAAAPAAEGTPIKASMMGIFYRAASPSSPPFVKEGETVKPGQILCMIEAMKVFNEIKAEYPCTVLKVLLENGKPVKSGQDLFLVKR